MAESVVDEATRRYLARHGKTEFDKGEYPPQVPRPYAVLREGITEKTLTSAFLIAKLAARRWQTIQMVLTSHVVSQYGEVEISLDGEDAWPGQWGSQKFICRDGGVSAWNRETRKFEEVQGEAGIERFLDQVGPDPATSADEETAEK